MAASPSQQTHWLKLRVDLGLERHSGMDLGQELDWGAVSALLCDSVVTECTHTADRQERGGLKKSYVFFSVGLCGGGFTRTVSRENPLHELLQKVRDCVFFYISHFPCPLF